MTTLNARANQAYHEVELEAGDDWHGFETDQDAFEEGWETGYKAKAAELSWWVTTGPFTDPLCQKIAGPFGSRDEAMENRGRIEEYTGPVSFWVDSPEAAEERAREIGGVS